MSELQSTGYILIQDNPQDSKPISKISRFIYTNQASEKK